MIKCNYFRKRIEYDDRGHSSRIYSAMSEFNKWDQNDVESIISIDTCCTYQGEVDTIVVYYNVKETEE